MNRFNVLASSAAIAGLAIAASAPAGVITISSSTPTVDGGDIANLTWTGTATDKTFSDATNPGQTFTTGNDAGYTLNSLSYQVNSTSAAGTGARTWTLRVVKITGGNNTTTETIEVGSTDAGGTPWSPGDWFTFSLATPIALDPNTLYGFDVEHTAGGDWGNGIPYFRYNNSVDAVAGAYRYTKADGDPATINDDASRDRVFHVDLDVVPEPGSLALLGLGGLLIARRRRG